MDLQYYRGLIIKEDKMKVGTVISKKKNIKAPLILDKEAFNYWVKEMKELIFIGFGALAMMSLMIIIALILIWIRG
jgi:hypothetical protein